MLRHGRKRTLKTGPIRNSVMQTFGPANSETRAANDVLKLAREAEPEITSYLFIDCGTEDFLFNDNREFVTCCLSEKSRTSIASFPAVIRGNFGIPSAGSFECGGEKIRPACGNDEARHALKRNDKLT